ncbi:MAG TPA: YmaF family protein [Syntrophomonas sp.]|nr:YmaF family protein [Syntrophomonas sp.]
MSYPNYTKHVHEFLGSTKVKECHTHRFAGVTFEGIQLANGNPQSQWIGMISL